MSVELDAAALARLTRWMDEHGVPGESQPARATLLTGGQANLVYRVQRGEHDLVLRRPPFGAGPERDRTMSREYTLLAALAQTDVPHSRVHALCEDATVLGASFYIMDFVSGWSPASCNGWPAPYDHDGAARRQLAFALIDALAALGRADWQAIGLKAYGRPEGFHRRQVDRWLSQFDSIRFRELPGLMEAGAWLRSNQPSRWTPGIMHGDYQFHNVMFADDAPRVAAIVDWELSTIGDPVLDLAWVFMSEDWNADKFDLSGMPSQDELIARYVNQSGRDVGSIEYYLILARFKMAVIMEGVYASSLRRPAAGLDVSHFGNIAAGLAHRAGELAQRSA